MGWVSVATLEENAYPQLTKEFYKTWISFLERMGFHVHLKTH